MIDQQHIVKPRKYHSTKTFLWFKMEILQLTKLYILDNYKQPPILNKHQRLLI